jgi:glutathione S-transferase
MRLLANTTSPYARIVRVALIEKGLELEPTLVDPWADDSRLREANAAARVPTLVLDDGTALTESLLIVQWLDLVCPPPEWPSLSGHNPAQPASAAGVLARAGVAFGAIDAAVHTIITRKVTAPVLFDDTPVGQRRQRTMAESLQRLDGAFAGKPLPSSDNPPTVDVIATVVALDYLRFRFAGAPWLPPVPALDVLAGALRERPSFAQTRPR